MDDTFQLWVGLVIGGVAMYFFHTTPIKDSSYVVYPATKISDSIAMPSILLDRNTGETWRFYRDINTSGAVTDEGWIPVTYKFPDSSAFAATPSIAYRNYLHSFDAQQEKKLKQYLSKESFIDDIRYYIYSQNNPQSVNNH